MNSAAPSASHTITTVIFDLDGLLADTEKLHRQAYQETLAAHGIALTDAEYDEHWIRSGKGIVEFVAERQLPVDGVKVREAKAERYNALVLTSAEPMPGAGAVLERLSGSFTLALGTASYREGAYAVLRTLGFEHFFSCIGTQADAPRTKPAPDVFLYVAKQLQVFPQHCLVLDDSEKGIRAAHTAGMHSFAVPNSNTAHHDFSQATRVLSSLNDVTAPLIRQIG